MPCAHCISVCPGTALCFLGSKMKLLLVGIIYNAQHPLRLCVYCQSGNNMLQKFRFILLSKKNIYQDKTECIGCII